MFHTLRRTRSCSLWFVCGQLCVRTLPLLRVQLRSALSLSFCRRWIRTRLLYRSHIRTHPHIHTYTHTHTHLHAEMYTLHTLEYTVCRELTPAGLVFGRSSRPVVREHYLFFSRDQNWFVMLSWKASDPRQPQKKIFKLAASTLAGILTISYDYQQSWGYPHLSILE